MKMQNSEPDHPDDRPPGRGHPIEAWLSDATGKVDPAASARSEAEYYEREESRHARSARSHLLHRRRCRAFAAWWHQVADAQLRQRLGRAA